MHPENVVIEAEDKEVSFIGVDLNSGNYQEFHALSEVDQLVVVPEEIVLGDGYAVQTGFLGFIDQVIGGKKTVVGVSGGVVVGDL